MKYRGYKSHWFNPKRLPITRGGPPPDVECPLQCGDFVSFEDCLDCDQFNDDVESRKSHCRIKEEERMEGIKKEEEEVNRRAAEWDAQQEREDRTMREEMAAWQEKMEKNGEKWQKEYGKHEEEDRKREKEWNDMTGQSLVDTYGREMIEFLEEMDEKAKELEDDEEDDVDENEEDLEDDSY